MFGGGGSERGVPRRSRQSPPYGSITNLPKYGTKVKVIRLWLFCGHDFLDEKVKGEIGWVAEDLSTTVVAEKICQDAEE